jgi:hypothetical protein
MPLPNAEQAIVELDKLTEYCLNSQHPRGRHKARVFESALGLHRENALLLRDALLGAAADGDAILASVDEFGARYVLDFQLPGPSGPVEVRSLWIVLTDESFARLVSCYVRD